MPLRNRKQVKSHNTASLIVNLSTFREIRLMYVHQPTGFVLKLDKYAILAHRRTEVVREIEFSSKEACMIPFNVALTTGNVFIFGKPASDYMETTTKGKEAKHWLLGYLLASRHVDKMDCVVNCNDTIVDINLETLLAMFFYHIIGLTEKMLNWEDLDSPKITKLIVLVPMWLPGGACQILQIAGHVVGVTLQFVYEVTFEAYISQQFARITRCKKKNATKLTLAVSNHSGHVDLAIYKSSGTRLDMLACVSTNFKAKGASGFDLDKENVTTAECIRERYNSNWWHNEEDQRMIICLLDEVFQVLSTDDEARCRKKLDVVVLADDEWWKIFLEEMLLKVKTVNLIEKENFQGDELIDVFDNILSGTNTKELSPYHLVSSQGQGKDNDMDHKEDSVWTTKADVEKPLTISESNGLGEKFNLGQITFSRILSFKYTHMEVSVKMRNSLGTIDLINVSGLNSKGERNDLTKSANYTWSCRSSKQAKFAEQRFRVIELVASFTEQYKAQLNLLALLSKSLNDQLTRDASKGTLSSCICNKCQKKPDHGTDQHELLSRIHAIQLEVQKINMYDKSVEFIGKFSDLLKRFRDAYNEYRCK